MRGFIAVSIHAPLARSNRRASKSPPPFELFQYMLLLRGATRKSAHLCGPRRFQYMLLLRGATCNQAGQPGRNKFQYMLLLRGATGCAYPPSSKWSVSIHTPLARCNGSSWHQGGRVKCFNTCSSCEEQLIFTGRTRRAGRFNTCSSCVEQHRILSFCVMPAGFNTCSSCAEQLVR